MCPWLSKNFCSHGSHVSLLFILKYPTLRIQFFPVPFLFSLLALFEYSDSAATMLFHEEEAVQFPFPVLETVLTAGEIQELLSLIQSGDGDATSPSSGSQGSNREVYSMDERKRRRMQSNRESARRSRWRKKRHLENLTNQVNRFSIENRQLKNRLGFAMHQHRQVCLENEQLISESVALLARLSDLCLILGSMHSQ